MSKLEWHFGLHQAKMSLKQIDAFPSTKMQISDPGRWNCESSVLGAAIFRVVFFRVVHPCTNKICRCFAVVRV